MSRSREWMRRRGGEEEIGVRAEKSSRSAVVEGSCRSMSSAGALREPLHRHRLPLGASVRCTCAPRRPHDVHRGALLADRPQRRRLPRRHRPQRPPLPLLHRCLHPCASRPHHAKEFPRAVRLPSGVPFPSLRSSSAAYASSSSSVSRTSPHGGGVRRRAGTTPPPRTKPSSPTCAHVGRAAPRRSPAPCRAACRFHRWVSDAALRRFHRPWHGRLRPGGHPRQPPASTAAVCQGCQHRRPVYVTFAPAKPLPRCRARRRCVRRVLPLCAPSSARSQPPPQPPPLVLLQQVHLSGDEIVCATAKGCRLFKLIFEEFTVQLIPRDAPALESVGPQKCLAFSTDGAKFAIGGEDRHLRIFHWPSMNVLLDEPKTHRSFRDMDISLDSKFLVSTSTDGSAGIWKRDEGVPLVNLTRSSNEKIECCRFSRDGMKPFLFCTIAKGNTVLTVVWSISEWSRIGYKRLLGKPISTLSVSMDGKYLALGSHDGDFCAVDVKTMEVSHWSKKAHLGSLISSIGFCPTERVVIATSNQWGAELTKLNVPVRKNSKSGAYSWLSS